MFRKIKKLYFKIYHLFKLLGIFALFFISLHSVDADTCDNLIDSTDYWLFWNSNYFLVNSNGGTHYYLLKPNTTYTIWFDTADSSIRSFLNANIQNFQIYHRWGQNTQYLLTIDTSLNYYTFTSQADLNNNNLYYFFRMNGNGLTGYDTPFSSSSAPVFYLIEGSVPCDFTPPSPPSPTPDSTYSNFLTIYFDRLIYLANGFTTNPYLLAMIGIIFSFVVLEIFLLFFHLKGGRRK